MTVKYFLISFFSVQILLLSSGWAAIGDTGVNGKISLPSELRPFVDGKIYNVVYVHKADLNRDNRPDYILVIEKVTQDPPKNPRTKADDTIEIPRIFMILQRAKNGQLVKVKENNNVVYCRECGGLHGDPFSGIEITQKGFVVHLYGGSGWRWGNDFEFGYSHRDKTWQLIRARFSSFHTSDPENREETVYTPPKDFGKIDIADFDPEFLMRLGKDAEKATK